ncbi:MAG: NDP-sugar synthase [Actinomycetota bacterium]|nr:NDP-sugar synthase [Actinomycetota bacterium]
MDAILLVGGQGTRLRPLTATTPKPMLPTAGVPFLTHQLAAARDAGVTRAILSTSYKSSVFSEHFADGAELGIELLYATEDEPLGTGGGIRHVVDLLRGGPVFIFNGDVLSGVDLRSLLETHRRTAADVTLYLTQVEDPRAFGLVPTDANGRVTAFLEKPQRPEEIVTDQINAGCYVFEPHVFERIPAGRPVSVERETFPELLASGARLSGHLDTTYWLDIGTPQAFVRGCCDLVLGTAPSPARPGPAGPALVLDGASVAPDAVLTGGTTVGAGAVVHSGAVLDGSVIFDGAEIGAGATVTGSVVGRDSSVGAGSVLDCAIVGDGVRIGARNELRSGVRLWPGAEIGDGLLRFSSDC